MNKKSFPSFKSAPKKDDEKKSIAKKDEIAAARISHTKASQPQKPSLPLPKDIFNGPLIFQTESQDKIIQKEPNFQQQFVKETFEARQSSFTRRLRKDTENTTLWFEFIDFQDRVESFKKLSRRKQVERKVSILEKAIEFNSIELSLILLKLELLVEIESFPGLLNKWDRHLTELESRDINTFWQLAFKYIHFRMSHFSCFNREEVMSCFAEFFKKAHTDDIKLELLKLLFGFLNKTGHFEYLVALVQATIEINVEVYNYGSIDLDAFADQWDSGLCDHIGCYVDTSNHVPDFESQAAFWTKWSKAEVFRSEIQLLPLIDDDAVDLERNVLFHDISMYVIIFDRSRIKSSLVAVLKFFFEAVGIPASFEIFKNFQFTHFAAKSPFLQFGLNCLRSLLSYFEDDWEFTCTFMLLSHAISEDIYPIKAFLLQHRQSLTHFFAFCVFNLLIGDLQQAKKVLVTVAEKDSFDCPDDLLIALSIVYRQLGNLTASSNFYYFRGKTRQEFTSWLMKGDFDSIQLDIENQSPCLKVEDLGAPITLDLDTKTNSDAFKVYVYGLIQNNVGDKRLYTLLISHCDNEFEDLGRELYCLMMEQQLRIRCLKEEVMLIKK